MAKPPALGARPLAAGALLAALALVLGLAAYYLPVVGVILTFVAPLPVAVAQLKYGGRLAALTSLVATALAGMLGGPQTSVFIAAGCAVGIALGVGIGRRWPALRTLVLAGIVGFAGTVVTFGVAVLVLGPQTLQLVLEETRLVLTMTVEAVAAAGAGPELLAQITQTTELMAANLPAYTLFALFAGSFMYAWLWYAACAPALSRLSFEVPRLPPVPPAAVWHLPPVLGLTCLATYFASMVLWPRLPPGSPAAAALQLAIGLVVWCFVIQGLGLTAHLLTRARLPAGARKAALVAVFVLMLTTPMLSQLVLWAGMFDLALDFRHLARGDGGGAGQAGGADGQGPSEGASQTD